MLMHPTPFLLNKIFLLSQNTYNMNSGSSNMHKTSALSNEIKVMVIDHKQDYLASVCDFLKSHSFEVTSVHQAGAALRLLTEKKDKYDLLLIDSDMRDVDIITFLRVTKNMDILSIVMCQEEIDDNFVLEVLGNGGFRVVKTPLTDDVIMHTRQDIIRARFRKSQQFKMVDESETREPESGDHQVRKKRVKRRSGSGEVKKKNWVEWTEELHSKFLKALHELGDGKCFPKTILDIMNVPGLTRLQVASHLQKYRHDARKMLQGKATPNSSNKNISSSNRSKEAEFRVYGSLPSVGTHVQNHDQISDTGKSSVNNQSITDYSLVNENRFENLKDMYYTPTDYDHNSFPTNQVSDDFFDFPNDMNENPSLACMELNGLHWNYDNISQQILPHDDQVMPAQGISEFNQHI